MEMQPWWRSSVGGLGASYFYSAARGWYGLKIIPQGRARANPVNARDVQGREYFGD
jgi:hypothetical protein